MGLDMYLNKETYVQNWEHHSKENKHTISVKKGGKVRTDIKPERITYITEQVGYWRKFNALHGWIVNNCADGVDECQRISLSSDDITKLLDTLKQVQTLLNKAKKVVKVEKDWNGEEYDVTVYDCEDEISDLLSPTQGFFFGGYQIDDYYKHEVDRSVILFEEILDDINTSKENGLWGGDYFYQASW